MSASPLPIVSRVEKARASLASRTGPFTVKDAADALGVHQTTLRDWRRRGLIDWPPCPSNRYRPPTPCVRAEDLRRLLGMSG